MVSVVDHAALVWIGFSGSTDYWTPWNRGCKHQPCLVSIPWAQASSELQAELRRLWRKSSEVNYPSSSLATSSTVDSRDMGRFHDVGGGEW